MDFLKSQFDRIQQQLNGLTASQKMLTGALVAIMVMTLLWWAKYAGQPEMEPLLSIPLAAEEADRIGLLLDGRGIQHEVTADKRILVPADRKFSALAAVGYENALPKNAANGFDEIIKQLTPWDGNSRETMMYNRGKEMTLGRVIGEFPGVASATVIIDPKTERHIGTPSLEPTAFVSIQMKSGVAAGDQLVSAAASAVAGAQTGLTLKNVKVVVDGVPHHAHSDEPEQAINDNVYKLRQTEEKRLTEKVARQLAEIQGVLVAVTVTVDPTTTEKISTKFGDVLSKETKVEEENSEQSGPAAPAAEPGATPNVGQIGGANGAANLAVGPGGGNGGTTQTKNKSNTEFRQFPNEERSQSKIPAGRPTPTGASIRVPRSYFLRVAKGDGTADPDEKTVLLKTKEVQEQIRQSVMKVVGLANPTDVTVDPYYDQAPLAAAIQPPTAAASVTLALGGHFQEIALGALALVSLFMALTIVKKGAPPPPAPRTPEPRPAPPVLEGGEMVAGEAAEGNPLLDGMELDDDAVKTQQMLQQVSTMVDENPDAAAVLVKRWLNRS